MLGFGRFLEILVRLGFVNFLTGSYFLYKSTEIQV